MYGSLQFTQSLIESLTVKITDRCYISVWQPAAAQFTQSWIECLIVTITYYLYISVWQVMRPAFALKIQISSGGDNIEASKHLQGIWLHMRIR